MTWAWYNVVISSGGVSLLLYHLPYRIHGLWIVGAIVYIIALILSLTVLLAHVVRFVLRPSLVLSSIMHPNEGLFVPTLPAALGILIMNAAAYSDKIHSYNSHASLVFYWIFGVLALIFGIGTPIAQFTQKSSDSSPRVFINTELYTSVSETNNDSQDITPSSLTMILPLVLAGPVAAAVLSHIPKADHYHKSGCTVLAFAVILQGMGTLLTLLYQSSIITKLQTDGFRAPRSALFQTVIGPALTSYSVTCLAQLAIAHSPKPSIPAHDPIYISGMVMYHIGVGLGLVFWGLAAWWFAVSATAILRMSEARDTTNGHFMQLFNVVFAHVTLFLASNELLRVFEFPKGLTALNVILGIGTVAVWALVALAGCIGIFSGRLMRD
jgi:tellurite resistance protein TehA-like permease